MIKEVIINGCKVQLFKSHPYFSPGFEIYVDNNRAFHGLRNECEKEFKKIVKNLKSNN